MDAKQKKDLLNDAEKWFVNEVISSHTANTKKLKNPKEFKINNFLVVYLSRFFYGKSNPEDIARILVMSRSMVTSINTTFGSKIQTFLVDALRKTLKQSTTSGASTADGIDFEFIDQIDKEKKYCQLKLGPNTINKSDIKTITDNLGNAFNRLKKNGEKNVDRKRFIVGIAYGEKDEISSHYKSIKNDHHYDVYVGKEFWEIVTGDPDFYSDLLSAIASVATSSKINSQDLINDTIKSLAQTNQIKLLSPEYRAKNHK